MLSRILSPNTKLRNVTLLNFVLRLLAVPFWMVERAREIAERKTGARRKKREETGGEAGRKGPFFSFPFSRLSPSSLRSFAPVFSLGYFARLLDYPERDCSAVYFVLKGQQ